MDAVQFMRHKAQQAGTLKTTPQQTVTDQGPTVAIQPADPDVVYVPDYDPELIYGYPVGLWPGFYPWWGVPGPYLSFGVGFGISPFFGFGWGWHAWGFDWGHRGLLFGGGRWVRSTATLSMTATRTSAGTTGVVRLEFAGTAASVDTAARQGALVRKGEQELALGRSGVMAAAAMCEVIRHADAPAWAAVERAAAVGILVVAADILAAVAANANNPMVSESRRHLSVQEWRR